ncbi:MAG: CAP domain-containing protein [bacterium]|nr:CAP domain-containing protein [bacterium]
MIELVNAERAKYGLTRLAESVEATLLARRHANQMARHGFVGHYDLSGRKCELRFNMLGARDHVAENIAYLEIGARVELSPDLVRSMFDDLLASRTHRANTLHPAHTHIGCAFSVQRSGSVTRIYLVQEFVNDWGDYDLLQPVVQSSSGVTLHGQLRDGAQLAYIGLAYERLPGDRTPKQVGEADLHYRQPEPSRYFEPGKEVQLLDGDEFEVNFPIDKLLGPLDVYVTVWVIAPGLEKPFRAMTQVLLLKRE